MHSLGDNTQTGMMTYSLQFAREGSIAVGRIGDRTCTYIITRLQREEKIQREITCSTIPCHHHAIGMRGKVATVKQSGQVSRIEVHSSHACLNVQITHIIAHLTSLLCPEYSRKISHQDRTEILI